ncbi:MAG: fluoride efflux transporter CrcB [Gordonia sp. (in: high G+C Gram-positive bacteria)]
MITAAVLLAGALGAVARFVVDGVVNKRWPTPFPWATVIINVTGSLILGILLGCVMFHAAPSSLSAIAGTGFCGGYTTFSTASMDSVRLAKGRSVWLSVTNAFGSLVASVAACALGAWLAWLL